MKRQMVQIPAEQVDKLFEIDNYRRDLVDYSISKKVHILLQERLAEVINNQPKQVISSTKGKWIEYIRELFPIYTIAPILLGAVRHSKEMIGMNFSNIMITSETDKMWWCAHKDDINNVGGYLISNLKDKKFSKKYYSNYINFCKELDKQCSLIKKKDLGRLSKIELLELYVSFYEKAKCFHGLTFDIDSVDIVLEKKIKNKLEELMLLKYDDIKLKKFNELYNSIITPIELSYVNKEELVLYEIVNEIQNDKKLLELFKKDVRSIFVLLKGQQGSVYNQILKLVNFYWWTSLSWTIYVEKDFNDVVINIKRILNENIDVDEEILRIKEHSEKAQKDKQRITKEFNFDDEMNYYLEVFEKYVFFHDLRKEMQMKTVYLLDRILQEIAVRVQVKYETLLWCWPDEVIGVMQGNELSYNKIRDRREAYFIHITQDSLEEKTSSDAIIRRKQELSDDVEDLQDFKGTAVSFGKTTGKVKVCYSAQDALKKVNEGDILIASMTLPDYLPAMKKAAAIVTDEGGITCHAAIVSREFSIPCIVGTKIATKVLNDNDLVEVNANHGRIKIIKRNN